MPRPYEFDDDEPYVVIEKQSGTLNSFFVGLAIGAGLALLFAPQSGERTRRDLQRRARRAQRTARRVATDVTDSVVDTFHDARRRVEERIDTARQAIEVKKEQVQRAMEAGRAAAQQAREELERRIAETKAAYQSGDEGAPATGGSAARRATPSKRPAGVAAQPDEEPEGT
jgi:gas vesicle protein